MTTEARVCALSDCKTVLSGYNTGALCNVHKTASGMLGAMGLVWRSWFPEAECWGHDPEAFFPDTTREDQARTFGSQRAKSACFRCLHRPECLALTLESVDSTRWGVAGGTTPDERARFLDAPDRLEAMEAMCARQASAWGMEFRVGGRAA